MNHDYQYRDVNSEEEWNKVLPKQDDKSDSQNCRLAIAIRVIGWINLALCIIAGLAMCSSGGLLSSRYDDNPIGLFCFIISGAVGCILCYGLAKCVEAAHIYLMNNSKSKN